MNGSQEVRGSTVQERAGYRVYPGLGYAAWRTVRGQEFCKHGHKTDGPWCQECADALRRDRESDRA